MSEWKTILLGEVLEIKYGKDHKKLADGNIPVYGSGGLMRLANMSLYNEESILIPRKGTLNNIMYCNFPFWTVDTMFYSIVNTSKVNTKFLFYQLKQIDFNNLNVGSAVPSLTVPTIKEIQVTIPPLPEQKAIAEVFSSLDDKIDLLHRNNKTLEKLAEALFRQWFVVGAKENWEKGTLGEFVTVKRGGSPRPIQYYLSEEGLRWLKISDVSNVPSPYVFDIKEHIKEEGINKTVLLKAGSLVVSNSATPGIPKILAVDTCVHDGWLYFPQSKLSNEFLYLFFLKIKEELVSLGNGSIFTNLKTDIVKSFPIVKPDPITLQKFDDTIQPIFQKIYNNTVQLIHLAKTKEVLLPKLMSGQVKVNI